LVLGGRGDDILTGSSGIDFLVGSEGNDILVSGIGNDVLSGGQGADTFTANTGETGSGNADTILDYNFLEGDKIDLSALLDIATGKNVTDYVDVTQNGSDITVRVDVTGGGSFEAGASEVYTLTGIDTDGTDPLSVLIDGYDHHLTV
jgi:Ca2+-binding RTX toxin-like protein